MDRNSISTKDLNAAIIFTQVRKENVLDLASCAYIIMSEDGAEEMQRAFNVARSVMSETELQWLLKHQKEVEKHVARMASQT